MIPGFLYYWFNRLLHNSNPSPTLKSWTNLRVLTPRAPTPNTFRRCPPLPASLPRSSCAKLRIWSKCNCILSSGALARKSTSRYFPSTWRPTVFTCRIRAPHPTGSPKPVAHRKVSRRLSSATGRNRPPRHLLRPALRDAVTKSCWVPGFNSLPKALNN